MGQDWIEQISFSSDFTTIGKNLEQVYQFMQLIRFAPSFPTHDYKDMRHRLRLLSTEGAIIAQDDLHDLNCSLKVMESVKAYLKDLDPEQYDELIALAKGKTSWQEFTEQADGIIDNKGEIRPDASAALEDITRKIKTLEKGLYSKIQQTLTQAKKSGWVGNEAEITVRNGRLVIPVFASQKRKLKGFIHDESSSGQTVYMEPEAAFEANNEIRKLGNAYRKEIKRILGEYSGKLRPWIFELIDDYQWLGKVDAIHSKALLAIKLHAEKPKLINEQGFSWQSAIHPLLYLVFKAQNKEVIPLNISLNKDQRILIISGPNAGGKSVCLKTTGLLQYMLQCGLLVPMQASSECGIFNDVFIDIGDEQSLENDLSTYSSHLYNIKQFISAATSRTLIMIDELGSGTEPQMGGAIAEASLETLYQKGAYAVITTHYANLKLLAEKYPGITNGAMLFDNRKLQPLYQLKTGQPGNSFAFEIARKTGLPEEILNRARKKTGETQLDFENQLQSLEKDRSQVDKKAHELNLADELLSETIEKYNKLYAEIDTKRNEILNKAKEEAKDILNESNTIIEKTIREIKESNADKTITKQARKILETKKTKITKPEAHPPAPLSKEKEKKKPIPTEKPREQIVHGPIKQGDTVKISGQQSAGEVLSITGQQARVLFGHFKMKIPLKKLEKTTVNDTSKQQARHQNKSMRKTLQEKTEQFSPVLDIRGSRAEEARKKLMHFLDNALLTGNYEVQILHGKGDGILRKIVREQLSKTKEVKHYKDAHIEQGGQGITIVKLD
ncbi:MAG: Smr/MutS family protein [Bacteroidales bacterium]